MEFIKFWMVMRLEEENVHQQSSQSAPRYKHYNHGMAKDEAERLARQNPGTQFVILEAREAACYQMVSWSPAVEAVEIPF